MSESVPLRFQAPIVQEDEARAGYYAVLSRLFYAGPDAALLESLARAGDAIPDGETTPLSEAWRVLTAAARATDAGAAKIEYDQLFVGTGKAEVTPYATHYLAESGREKILVKLRQDLESMGLARASSVREPEDHVSALLEVMRHLISLGSDDDALQKQREFFGSYLEQSVQRLCAAISASENASFYKRVSEFGAAFMVVETDALKVF